MEEKKISNIEKFYGSLENRITFAGKEEIVLHTPYCPPVKIKQPLTTTNHLDQFRSEKSLVKEAMMNIKAWEDQINTFISCQNARLTELYFYD